MRSIYLSIRSELMQIKSRCYAIINMRPLPHCCTVCSHSEYHKFAVSFQGTMYAHSFPTVTIFLAKHSALESTFPNIFNMYREMCPWGRMQESNINTHNCLGNWQAAMHPLEFPFLSPDTVPTGIAQDHLCNAQWRSAISRAMLCKDTGFDGCKPLFLAAALTSAALTAPFAIAKRPWVLESEDTSYNTCSFKGCSCTCFDTDRRN